MRAIPARQTLTARTEARLPQQRKSCASPASPADVPVGPSAAPRRGLLLSPSNWTPRPGFDVQAANNRRRFPAQAGARACSPALEAQMSGPPSAGSQQACARARAKKDVLARWERMRGKSGSSRQLELFGRGSAAWAGDGRGSCCADERKTCRRARPRLPSARPFTPVPPSLSPTPSLPPLLPFPPSLPPPLSPPPG